MNPWNTSTSILLDETRKRSILAWYELIASATKPKRQLMLLSHPIEQLDNDYLRHLYIERGIGIKVLSRAFGLTYSRMRTLLNSYARIELRTCRESTDFLRSIRSERVLGKNNPWYDWPSSNPQLHRISRGIQGYYERTNGQHVWLRSSWEYIYASWLDANHIEWKYEDYGITLSNGERYRPDFLIYENGQLTKIVEIKGYFDNRRYKAEILKQDLAGKVEVVIIDDISVYTDQAKRNTETWKQLCKSPKLRSSEST